MTGTYRAGRHGGLADVAAPTPTQPVSKPETLSAGASKVWDMLAPICIGMGVLTAADIHPFSTLCELQSSLERAAAQKDGPAASSTVLRTERQTAAAIRPYYAMFGLGPGDRARLRVAAPEPASANPLDKYIRRSKWADLIP